MITLPSLNLGNIKVKSFIKTNFKFFILLSFFGKFVDILDSNIQKWLGVAGSETLTNKLLIYFFIFFEEIGEITVISLIFIWLFNIASNKTLISKKK